VNGPPPDGVVPRPAQTAADRRSPIRRALAVPQFRRLFLAQTISRWGDTFNAVALVILVYRLTGSGVKVAGTVAFEVVPVVALGFVAGTVIDRYPRVRVMVGADLARALIAIALSIGQHHLWAVYAAAFGLSAFSVFFSPAAASIVPVLVGDDEVVGANSAIWSAAVISQIVLAPLAGGLVAFAGAGPAFLLNAASFVVSAGLLVRLGLPVAPRQIGRRRFDDVTEGLRVIRGSRLLRTLAAVQGLAALSAGATSALLVVLAERHLHLGSARFGWLLAAIGIGAGFGPLLLQKVVRDVRRPRFLFGPYIVRGVVDLTLAATRSFPMALGALGVYGLGTSTGNVTYQSVLQQSVPDRLRGRVFAFYDVVWQTGRLLSIGVGGLLADGLGIVAVYIFGGALLVAAGLLGLVRAGDLGVEG